MTEPVNSLDQALELFSAVASPPDPTDRRDLGSIFGKTDVREGRTWVRFNNEAELRRALATIAHGYGWLVEEEVVVPGWGRIDLVLRQSELSHPRLVELKLDLRKPSAIRRAFQQADGYGRWWVQHHCEPATVTLAGADVDAEAMDPVARAYPEVGWRTVSDLMARLCTWDDPRLRRHRAISRRRRIADLAALYDHLHDSLDAVTKPPEESTT